MTGMTPEIVTGMTPEAVAFTSVAAFEKQHRHLIELRHEKGGSPAFHAQVMEFLEKGSRTGTVLDRTGDRRVAQSILDLWVATLGNWRVDAPSALLPFDPEAAPDLDEKGIECPYLGLEAFKAEHRHLFFGRQPEIDSLIEHLDEHRFAALVGASGSGKSSVLLAGVLPQLQSGALTESRSWRHLRPMVPGSNPVATLHAELSVATSAAPCTVEELRRDPAQVTAFFEPEGPPVLVTVDQFEEVFTLCEKHEAQAFVEALVAMVDAPQSVGRVLISIRADYEGNLGRFERLQELYSAAHERVLALGAGELRLVIERPAAETGLRFEEGVIDRLVRDISGESAALPLLQFTLRELWDRKDRNRVTLASYEELGGGRRALKNVANEFYEELIPQEQTTVRRILLRLVRPGQGLDMISKRVSRHSLVSAIGGSAEPVLDKLIAARLVRVRRSWSGSDDHVEVAHEALIRNWDLLEEWLEEEHGRLTVGRRLDAKALEWVHLGRGAAGLMDAVELSEAEAWLSSKDGEEFGYDSALPDLVVASREKLADADRQKQELLQATQKLAETQADLLKQQRKAVDEATRKFQALAVLAFLTLGVIAVGARIHSQYQAKKQEISKKKQEISNQRRINQQIKGFFGALDLTKLSLADVNAERGTRAALESVKLVNSFQGDSARESGGPPAELERVQSAADLALRQNLARVIRSDLLAHHPDETIFAVGFGPDDQILGYVGSGGLAWLERKPLTERRHREGLAGTGIQSADLEPHDEALWGISFDPRGERVATAGAEGSLRIYSTTVPSVPVFSWNNSSGVGINDAVFLPDQEMAVAFEDSNPVILNLETNLTRVLKGHTGRVFDLDYSSSKELLATAGTDNTARLWSAETGQPEGQALQHEDRVYSVSFSPKGEFVATASADRRAYIWSIGGELEAVFAGHSDQVRCVAWSADGDRLATASTDGTARVWDVRSSREILRLTGHNDGLWSVAFSSDGTKLITGGEDGEVRLWHLPAGHGAPITDVARSPNGEMVLSADTRGVIKLWRLNEAGERPQLELDRRLEVGVEGHNEVAFGAEGLFAVGDATGRVRVFDAKQRQHEPIAELDSGELVWGLAFSDGVSSPRWLAASTPSGNIVLWDISDLPEVILDPQMAPDPGPQNGEKREIFQIVFSRDGTRLYAVGYEKQIRIFDITGSRMIELDSIVNDQGRTYAIGFDAMDPGILITAGAGGVVRRWSTADRTERGEIGEEIDGSVFYSFAQDEDGSHLAIAGSDVKIWRRPKQGWAGIEPDSPPLVSVRPHGGFASPGILFSPDGRWLITGGLDGWLRHTPVEPEDVVREAERLAGKLTQGECDLFKDIPLVCRNRQ